MVKTISRMSIMFENKNLLRKINKQSYSVYDINDYFEKVELVIKEQRITKRDFRSMDMTSFRIDYRKIQLVVLPMIDQKNYDYIIQFGYIS